MSRWFPKRGYIRLPSNMTEIRPDLPAIARRASHSDDCHGFLASVGSFLERLREILEDVVNMLDPDAQPNHFGGHTHAQLFFRS